MAPTPASSRYSDLARIRTELDAGAAALVKVTAGLSDSALKWQTDPVRARSIPQCIDRLALLNGASTSAMRALMRRKASSVVRAPGTIVPPAGRSKAEVSDTFRGSHNKIRTLTEEAGNPDLNRLRFRNPLFPILRVRVGAGRLIMPAHQRHHLWQAQRVREAMTK